MKLSLSLLAGSLCGAALALSALPAHAQSVAKSGQQCPKNAEQTATMLDCADSEGTSDLSFYLEEFAQCDSSGNIKPSSFARSITIALPSGDTLESDAGDPMQIEYSADRTHIDFITGDNFSMIFPKSVVVKDGSKTIKISVTKQTELDYDGAPAEESHFKGSYVETDATGKQVLSGKLECGIEM